MEVFYLTFMTKQPFKDFYVQIIAPNESLAREAAVAQFSDQFFTTYPADDFTPEYYTAGQLCTINVYGQGQYRTSA